MNTYTVYDTVGRKVKSVGNYVAQATPPDDWVWREVSGVFGWRLSATNDTLVSHGANNDQNSITANTYDLAGRVISVRDTVGRLTQYTYDAVGRLTKTISNYVDGVFNSSNTDEDIISQTAYNKAGQVINTTNPHGTITEFGYDVAGRRVSITQAEGTALETVSYTCFNKAGWVLRTISNWIDNSTSPDAKTGTAWDFNPSTHGTYNDENLITEYEYDALGRQTKIINPLGEFTSTTYAKDGSVMSITDQEGTVTAYRYDKLRRRRMVVQGYVANDEDPANWVWDTTDERWEETDMTDVEVEHGTDNDQNIIIQLTHDIAGRVTEMRNPRGFVTEYEYDHLNRRTKLENPLGNAWLTTYQELGNGGRRTVMTYPEDTTSVPFKTTRDFDRMGRLMRVDYGQPSSTPNVQFEYDVLGNRTAMNELGVADDLIRQTVFAYDDARRMTSVGYDSDGDAIINETVSYEYDERGLRTKLTFDGKNITYSYDAKGRLISMTDWDSRTTTFDYDDANRHRLTTRHNAVTSAYAHNTAGQLTDIHHKDSTSATLAHFAYTLNGRGHRTQANETLNGTDTTITYAYDQLARVKNAKYYAGTVPTGTPADEYAYAFDVAGNRLSESHSVNGTPNPTATYDYNDANRVVTRTKNSVVENFGYDANGNLTSIGSLTYTWDRANRLKSVGAITYTYDGLGNRIQLFNQLGSSATETTTYLPDMQGGLTEVLQASTNQSIYGNSSSITRTYVHEPRGLGAYYLEKSGMVYAGFIPRWMDTLEDGLGSIRAEINPSQNTIGSQTLSPFGNVMNTFSTIDSLYGFTGEMVDVNNLVYLRARYYDPNMGSFVSLDPFEGMVETPLSLNGYTYVEGNPINWVDPSGLCPELSDEVYNMADYLHCHDLVRRLKDWNIKVIWDENSLSPLTCIPQTVRDTAEQLQGIKQRWTANEVRAIYNAFQIFNNAHQNLLLISRLPIFSEPRSYGYKWPRERAITIEKQQYVSTRSEDIDFMGKTDSENDIIVLSAVRWGEANENMTMQPRSWLVLHEFSHIYIWDRAKFVRPDYYNIEAEWRNKFGGFISSNPTRPTQYAGASLKEYLTESITGVLWNLGYIAVQGYDSGAGGWTGYLEQPSLDGYVNVSNITGESNGEQISLGAFIFKEIIMPLTPSP